MATLTVTQTEDYSDGSPALASDITSIIFTAGPAIATFRSNQFGPGLISNNVAITGDNSTNTIRVNLSATGTFSAAGWSFTNWSSSDVVVFADTAGNDTISGSDFNDRFLTGAGADNLNGRGGDDLFVFDAGDIVAGEVINGGSHTTADGILIATSGVFDFSVASITAVEELNLVSSGVTTIFGDTQLRLDKIAAVTGNLVQTQAIVVNGNDVDLSGVTFTNWGGANQTISISGTNSVANTLIGSSQNETFDNSASSADLMTGGGGADVMHGRAGDDTFIYNAPDEIVSGETADGGTGTDTLRIAGGGIYEFGSSSITSIEAITFTNSPTFAEAHFNADQFGGTGISNSVTITGSASVNRVEVQLTAAGTFSAAAWVLSNFGLDGDAINLIGSAGADTITGSSLANQITGGNGADHLIGGGRDTFLVDSNDIVAGEIIDGSADNSATLNLTSSNATTNVSPAALISIENLSLNNRANITAILSGNQIGAGAITRVLSTSGDRVQTLIVNANGNVDLSAVTFTGWDSPNKTITINGTPAGEDLTGSSQNDTINGGAGNDVVDGGGGTIDTASYSGTRAQFRVNQLGNGDLQVVDLRPGTPDGIDTVRNVERFSFLDGTFDASVVINTAPVHWIGSVDVGSHPSGYIVGGAGDFNGDGTNDVLWFNAGNGHTDVWKTANGQWAGSVDIGHHPLGYAVSGVGDFNADGTDDVLWYNQTTTHTEIWRISNGGWAGSVDIGSHPAGWKPAGVGDFNGDGTNDVLWFNQSTGNTEIWKLLNGQWAGSVDVGNHPAGYTVAGVGDFNADGTDDVLWFNAATGDAEVWKISNAQWAGSVNIGLHPPGWTVAGVGDFNADGTDDVLWFEAASGATDIWLINDGHWAGSVTVGAHPTGWTPVGVGDLDHNTIPDVTWQENSTGHIEQWLLA